MASEEKVQRFFKVAEVSKQNEFFITELVSQMKSRFVGELTEENNNDEVKIIEVIGKMNRSMGKKSLEFSAKLYEELFTDQELDELIEIYASPAFSRLRELAPELTSRLLNHVMSKQEEYEKEFKRIMEEVFDNDTKNLLNNKAGK